MVFIKWVYISMYDGDGAKVNEELVSNSTYSLFKFYESTYKKDDGTQSHGKHVPTISSSGLGKRSFEMYLDTVDLVDNVKSDLNLYLEEKPIKDPTRGNKFDVLQWWMANELKYPILSKMAKDILSIPITSVASEATFSAGKRIIDAKRSSMKVETVEMLLCGGDCVKELYGMKKGHGRSILEEEEEEDDVHLEYDFAKVKKRQNFSLFEADFPTRIVWEKLSQPLESRFKMHLFLFILFLLLANK